MAVIIDKNGNILLEKGDTKNRVSFAFNEVVLFADNIVTHNRPGGTGPSPRFVRTAVTYQAPQMRAVESEYRYVIQPGPRTGWNAARWHYVAVRCHEAFLTEAAGRGGGGGVLGRGSCGDNDEGRGQPESLAQSVDGGGRGHRDEIAEGFVVEDIRRDGNP